MHPRALIFLALCLPLLAQTAHGIPPLTPILIDVSPDSDGEQGLTINRRKHDLSSATRELAESAKRFGRWDPVIIRVPTIEGFSLAEKVAAVAAESRDAVYLALGQEHSSFVRVFPPGLTMTNAPQTPPGYPRPTAIMLVLTEGETATAQIEGRRLSIAEAEAWLRDCAERLGEEVPAVLVVNGQVPATEASAWMDRVRKLHRNAWMFAKDVATENEPGVETTTPLQWDYVWGPKRNQRFVDTGSVYMSKPPLPTGPPALYNGGDTSIPPPQELIDRVQRHVESERGKSKSDEVAASSPPTAAASTTTTIRNLSGIAVALIIDPNTQRPTIRRVLPGGPAEKVGLRANDSIVKVDGMDVAGLGSESVVTLLRGDPGTTVEVTVLREGVADPLSFTITREVVRLPDVGPPTTGSGDYLSELQWNIRTLEASLSEAIADGLGEQHPDIKARGAKLDALEKECAKFLKQAPEPDNSPQPTPTNQQPQ